MILTQSELQTERVSDWKHYLPVVTRDMLETAYAECTVDAVKRERITPADARETLFGLALPD